MSYTCSICHRRLSDPRSVRRGIGPVCAARQGRGLRFEPDSFPEDRWLDDPPFTEAFVCERRYLPDATGGFECSVTYTNIPHLTVWHSPTGFEWGYWGSGPADLALNILEATLRFLGHVGPRVPTFEEHSCFALASVLHQDFKREFVAPLPRDEGRIPFEAVVTWLHAQLADPDVQARMLWYAVELG